MEILMIDLELVKGYLLGDIGLAVLVLFLTFFISKFVVARLKSFALKTSNVLDDVLFGNGIPGNIVWLVGLAVIGSLLGAIEVVRELLTIGSILLLANALHRLISGISVYLEQNELAKRLNLRGFMQVAVVLVYLFAMVLVVSVLNGQSLGAVFLSLWGLAFGLTYLFKEIILNLFSALYLVLSGKMNLGDWVVVDDKGIDGDVVEIGLMTSAVKQWDQTIVSVPTKSLLDGFKNWRHINEARGRRIKERLWIAPSSINIPESRDVIKMRLAESGFDILSAEVMDKVYEQRTNLGAFREYLYGLIQSRDDVYANYLTTLVRTLEPTPKGVPIQIYVFCKDTNWIPFEGVRSRLIEDALLLAEDFDLELFECKLLD